MSQGRPNRVLRWCLYSDILLTSPERQFQHNTEYITVVLFLILLTKCVAWNAGKLAAIYFYSFEETSFSKRTKKTCVGWRALDVPRTSILKLLYKCIFITLFSIPFYKMCAWNNKGLAVIILHFRRNVLKTSYKHLKVTSGGWCCPDVPRASILNINTKHISVVIFWFLVYQMCVLDENKLVISYFFSFGETF